MKSVLILFASRFGSTEEIANEIADVLEKYQIATKKVNLANADQIPALKEFNGIIIGSGIKMGSWHVDALNFLSEKQNIINTKTVGLFVSSGEASNPKTYPGARRKYLDEIVLQTGIAADMMEAFRGVFDLSPDSSYTSSDKKHIQPLINYIKKDLSIRYGEINDYRNWKSIRKWATEFSQLIRTTFRNKQKNIT